MGKTLFDEAVADANKLRELAEETAKNKVVEAVMPQIRDLINRKILGEDIDLEELSDIEELDDLDSEDDQKELTIDSGESAPDISIEADGDVTINLEIEAEDDDEDLVMDQAMAEALSRLVKGDNAETVTEQKLNTLEENVRKLSTIVNAAALENLSKEQAKRLNISYMYCLREALKMKSEIILTERTTQERLERRLTETIKEIRKMSKSNRRNIFDFLFENEEEKKEVEDLEEAELSLELSADEQEQIADAEDAGAVGDALEDILGDIELSLGAEEGEEAEEAEEAEDAEEAEEGEEDAEGEDEVELDLEEADHMEGSYAEGDMDEVYEIDENMLRRELANMISEDATDEIDQFGGAEEIVGDVLLDVSEEDLINALADELGEVSESRNSRRQTRSSSRALTEAKKEILQYKRAVSELKGQLVEMNLFNAKLLYANKLMQNKDLTIKQQKSIVEALDNAKTLREAKLLFKSLTESLNRRSNRKSNINEGSLRTIGSASRSTRSGAPKQSTPETDRWALLAGLKEDKG